MAKVIYVMGTSHCGSTLFSFLLNSHPDIVSVGQASPSYRRNKDRHLHPCSCGEPIGNCSFWSQLFKRLNENGVNCSPVNWPMHYTKNKLVRNILFREHSNFLLQVVKRSLTGIFWPYIKRRTNTNVQCIKTILEISKKSVLADISKQGNRYKLLAKSSELDISLIWLVRDVRGFIWSMKKRNVDFDTALKRWLKSYIVSQKVYDEIDEKKRMVLKYEDLCRDYRYYMNKIFNFVGLKEYDVPKNYKEPVHHIIGNKMRLQNAREIKDNEEWKINLTSEEKNEAKLKASKLIRQLDYE